MTAPVFRFAPSPNGYLHLGHAFSALLNFDMARAAGGRLLLRIEDIDATRCRPEFEAAIYEDLAWLGIEWEQPVRRQSEYLSAYREQLDRLDAKRLLFPSFETRAEIARMVADRQSHARWPRDPDGVPIYPGAARALPVDQRASPAAGAARASRADLSPSSAHRRRRRPETLEIHPCDRPARAARTGTNGLGNPRDNWALANGATHGGVPCFGRCWGPGGLVPKRSRRKAIKAARKPRRRRPASARRPRAIQLA